MVMMSLETPHASLFGSDSEQLFLLTCLPAALQHPYLHQLIAVVLPVFMRVAEGRWGSLRVAEGH